MRPTGRLHIGHYFGALQNWAKLQNDPTYECFYFIADWHALTSDYADTSQIAQNTLEIATDWLAAGLDPTKSTFFVQSQVPEHAELHLLLSMVTPLGWLERVPTYKEQLDNIRDKDLHTYGFLGYPVLQCADIVIYSQPGSALAVPVGEDQVSHIELSREIVRRFDLLYFLQLDDCLRSESRSQECLHVCQALGMVQPPPGLQDFATNIQKWLEFKAQVRRRILELGSKIALELLNRYGTLDFFIFRQRLQEPEVMLTHTPRIPGTDGRKMSKSYGNAIVLSESDDSIRARTKVMVTDPARKRRTDPGNPDVCPVYDWHKLFSPQETLDWAAQGCRTAAIGCIECKAAMADHLIKWIAPIRERRLEYEAHPEKVKRILAAGSAKARPVAQQTMKRVREAVFGAQSIEAEAAPDNAVTAAKPTGAGN
jgi:tryptophanyl-tRNA synthetase